MTRKNVLALIYYNSFIPGLPVENLKPCHYIFDKYLFKKKVIKGDKIIFLIKLKYLFRLKPKWKYTICIQSHLEE